MVRPLAGDWRAGVERPVPGARAKLSRCAEREGAAARPALVQVVAHATPGVRARAKDAALHEAVAPRVAQ